MVCVDPCRGACGIGATCTVENHQPFCLCPDNPYANPLIDCTVRPPTQPPPTQPAVEEGCVVNSQCERDEVCRDRRCVDPCPGLCGVEADCLVDNHRARCQCREGYQGDPYSICKRELRLNWYFYSNVVFAKAFSNSYESHIHGNN